MAKPRFRHYYSPTFKSALVKLVLEQGVSMSELSRNFDVAYSTLFNWVHAARLELRGTQKRVPTVEEPAPAAAITHDELANEERAAYEGRIAALEQGVRYLRTLLAVFAHEVIDLSRGSKSSRPTLHIAVAASGMSPARAQQG